MIIKRSVTFTPADKPRQLHIYLPDHYEETDERYPVMYFFDGHNLFSDEDATYGKSWGLKSFLESWHKPMIIVGIECGHEPNERLYEYAPYHLKGGRGVFADLPGTGADTLKWIAEELKPMIDAEYRTYSFREATAIGGSSMGGLMSLYAAICHNDTFSKAACLSSSIGLCMDDLASDIDSHNLSPDTKVYLSWGTEEAGGAAADPAEDFETVTAGHNLTVEHLLQEKDVQTHLYCQRWGGHCEADWEAQVPRFMDALWLR